MKRTEGINFAFSKDGIGINGNDFLSVNGQNETVLKHEVKQETDFQNSVCSPLSVADMSFDKSPSTGTQKYTAFIPNKGTIQKYDAELKGFLQRKYVSELLKTRDRKDSIMWYRSVLFSRALSIEGCPKEKLCVRMTTNRSTCNEYAEEGKNRLLNFN